jgi:hypothetical protein
VIVVEISGDQKIKKFSVQGIISEEAIAVLNKAIKKSQELAASKLQSMTVDWVACWVVLNKHATVCWYNQSRKQREILRCFWTHP